METIPMSSNISPFRSMLEFAPPFFNLLHPNDEQFKGFSLILHIPDV